MESYCKEVLKVVVAQICMTMGWHRIQSSPMEVMVDILSRYMREMATTTHRYTDHYGMTEPTMEHIGMMMRDMHININEIEEYINWVEPVPCAVSVPHIPVSKESQLNFLKPGSREVVTRPVYVHEHLPPMYPELEEEIPPPTTPTESMMSTPEVTKVQTSPEISDGENVFKRPGDPVSDGQVTKRTKLSFGEEGRPTREISSVMMTSSGFLSPAREGKLPEARTPQSLVDAQNEIRMEKKIKKLNEMKRKEFKGTELFKPDKLTTGELSGGMKIKKIPTNGKDVKIKPFKSSKPSYSLTNTSVEIIGKGTTTNLAAVQKQIPAETKVQKVPTTASLLKSPFKIEDASIQITSKPAEPGVTIIEIDDQGVRKLSNEPDKVKLNIFKKISSKNKDEAKEKSEKDRESHFDIIAAAASKDLHAVDIIPIGNDTIKPEIVKPEKCKTPEITIKEEPLFSGIMQNRDIILTKHVPTTDVVATPKTPDIVTKKVKIDKDKKKRKDKIKKAHKLKHKLEQEKKIKVEKKIKQNDMDFDEPFMDRPKTPNDPITIKPEPMPPILPPIFPLFGQFPSGPGLIPKTVYPPFFPRGIGKHGFGQPPLLPTNTLLTVTSPTPPVTSFKQEISSPPREKATITPVKPEPEIINLASPPPTPERKPEKKSKEHKKEKKDKLDKLEKLEKKKLKKKDKKEKKKGKDKALKKLEKLEKLEKIKKIKKEKREKHKEKLIAAQQSAAAAETAVPKLTLKLGPQQRESTPDGQMTRKITIKSVKKNTEDLVSAIGNEREMSPELARISALVTRPPKTPKPTSISGSILAPTMFPPINQSSDLLIKKTIPKELKIKTKEPKMNSFKNTGTVFGTHQSISDSTISSSDQSSRPTTIPPPHPDQQLPVKQAFYFHEGASAKGQSGSLNEKDSSPSVASSSVATTPSSRSHVGPGRPRGSTNAAKAAAAAAAAAAVQAGAALNMAPIAPPAPPVVSASSAISTPARCKYPTPKPKSSLDLDRAGEKVWICPACGGQDDGSPMIGCDDCDAWYHWVCVGIQVPPDENEDWYCKICISKKQETFHTDKKKKRKKKERKD